MTQANKCVDIIVPVYNAYEDLQRCIDSVKCHSNLVQNRLILINDLSSDECIAPYLDSLVDQHVKVIHNKVNMGFSASINAGIAQSENNDVILLNSDTIVTNGWIEKMLACAYSDMRIATVTPLSNNATIYSVPMFYEENKLPGGFTIDEYAALVEACSLKKYPAVPVAHGFCMFIKREIIDKIGNFDADTFEKGYGEENDFCYRAGQLGYHHVMCDDTYIYHSGTSSFQSDEKKHYIKEHEKIIIEKYPIQHKDTAMYCANRPNEDICINIKIQTVLHNNRKNILYLLHSDFRLDAEDHIGGTQLHVKDLCEGLRNKINVFVAARNQNYLNITAYVGGEELLFQFFIGNIEPFPVYRNLKFAELYSTILDSFQIDIVHIHHLANLTMELYYQALERKIPIFTTLHDYFSVCPTIKLMDKNGNFCDRKISSIMCRECLEEQFGIASSVDFMLEWRNEHRLALQLSQRVFVPSESAKMLFLSYYPELIDKMYVIPHGSKGLEPIEENETEKDISGFRVAFIGGISAAKGSHNVVQMIKHGSKDIHWYLFGLLGDNNLSEINKKNLTKTGEYDRNELPTLIRKFKIDLICILPIWAETFCYTLSEAVLCGVPVIVTDIGALGERVRDLQCGWVVPKDATYKDILDIIKQIKDKGNNYLDKKENAKYADIKGLEEMCHEYEKIYESAVSNDLSKPRKKVDYAWIVRGRGKALGHSGLQGIDRQIYEYMALTELQLKDIKNSMAYKVAKILANMKIPFRRQIKSLLYRGYFFVRKRR